MNPLFSFLLLCALPTPHAAETTQKQETSPPFQELATLSIEELAEVRVTTVATGTRISVSQAPAVTTLITAQEIEAMGARTLEQVLDTVPGMHVSLSGQSYSSRYLIRGISTRFNPETLVMINGVPITSLLRGDHGQNMGSFPISMISRVEIIRGPGSAVYGTDAFAGVVNIVTKEQEEIDGYRAGALIGNFNTQEVWLQYGRRHGDLSLVLMADYLNSSGHRRAITEDGQTALDAAFGTQASYAPGPVNLTHRQLELFLDVAQGNWRLRGSFESRTNLGNGQGVAEALDPHGRAGRPRSTAELTFHDEKLGEHWDFSSQLAYLYQGQTVDRDLWLFPPGANLGRGPFPYGVIGNPEYDERQLRFANVALFTGWSRHRIRFGAGAYYGQLYQIEESKNFSSNFTPLPVLTDVSNTPNAFITPETRSNLNGFIQDEWRITDRWEATAGVRFDHYSDFGNTTNPRVALVWKTTPALTSKLLYGRGFRAPTFAELYTVNNPVAIGNPGLVPETIQVLEIAWSYAATPVWQAGLNLYHYDVDDLIEFVRDTSGLSATAQNQGTQKGNGLELDLRLKAGNSIFVTANYSLQRSRNETADAPAGFYPNQRAYLRTDWLPLDDLAFGVQGTWIGKREREPKDPRSPLGGYASFDLIIRNKNLLRGLSLMATIRNLFDADIREPSSGPGPTSTRPAIPNDLPQAGRSLYGEAVYHF